MFTRKFSKDKREKLIATDIFKDKILNDIKNEGMNIKESKQYIDVFPAIRNEYIDFYHGGGRLFHFNGKFKTHFKYASVYDYDNKDSNITEDQLNKMKPITNFMESYDQIKKMCCLYADVEAKGVSRVYKKYSYLYDKSDIVILDIEIAFSSKDEAKMSDKSKGVNIIDLLLYNKRTKTLRFYEAKHYSNPELWSSEGNSPRVISQIKRYKERIFQAKEEILNAYREYIDMVNQIFGLTLEKPEKLDPEVGLLVFGFDNEQKNRLKKLLEADSSLKDIKYYYAKGDERTLNIETLWQGELKMK
ncbi:MAG: hypothetical protein JJT76_15880 [Clostridiaceae bacterium]|nr:hypothetical protein [Clostridiaceae bacterium]